MKRASIDIGTNTLRLLIAEVGVDGKIEPLLCKRAITRLGGGYTEKVGISEEAAERSMKALSRFAEVIISEGLETENATVSATSVMRRACNAESIVRRVKERTGLEIEIITGEQEASLSMLGVTSVLSLESLLARRPILTIDIGGGSTEFIASSGSITGPEIKGAWSLELGVVHLSEQYLLSDPPKQEELVNMTEEIEGVIGVLKAQMKADGIDLEKYYSKDAIFVGTAGTVTTLAAIEMKMDEYDPDRINNYTLTEEGIEVIFDRLKRLTLKEREKIPSIEKGREDLIVTGIAIILLAMRAFGFKELVVSDAGLLEGLLLA